MRVSPRYWLSTDQVEMQYDVELAQARLNQTKE